MLSVAEHGIPSRVLAKMQILGVHNDCLVAGPDKACDPCTESIRISFDFFYGDLTTNEKIGAIIADLISDAFEVDEL